MRDALAVSGFERGGDTQRQPDCFRRRKRAARRSALDVLHDQVIRADIVERADVGMIQRGDGAGFALEAIGKLVRAELDRHVAIQPRYRAPSTLRPCRLCRWAQTSS